MLLADIANDNGSLCLRQTGTIKPHAADEVKDVALFDITSCHPIIKMIIQPIRSFWRKAYSWQPFLKELRQPNTHNFVRRNSLNSSSLQLLTPECRQERRDMEALL